MRDQEIIQMVLEGDKDSYGLIVNNYKDKLGRYINRFLSDTSDNQDVLQNTFIKAYQNLNSYNSAYSFNSWIYRIAHNESVNYLKKNKKAGISFVDFDTIAPSLFAKEKADDLILDKEKKEEVENALKNLNVKYREILILNFFQDLSYEEISEILKIPISTVGTRIRRAKEMLSKDLIINKS